MIPSSVDESPQKFQVVSFSLDTPQNTQTAVDEGHSLETPEALE